MTKTIFPDGSLEEPVCGSALPAPTKVFLAASIVFIGVLAVVVFWQGRASFPYLVFSDYQLLVPTDPERASVGESKENEVVSTLPILPSSLQTDQGSGKYAHVYPPPILTEDASLKDVPAKAGPNVLETERKTGRTFITSATELKPIYQFAPLPTVRLDRTCERFKEKPEAIDSSRLADEMLPLFHFAENMKPLTIEEPIAAMPENPFPNVPMSVIGVNTVIDKDPNRGLVPLSLEPAKPLVPLSVETKPLKLLKVSEGR